MSIKGALQAIKINDYGFASIKMGGAWYGSDKKGFKPEANEGQLVEFEAFKNAKGYDTYKAISFKALITANTDSASSSPASTGAASPRSGTNFSAGSRDSYWADKAKSDESKEPRIAYFAALDRAIAFVDLALRNGAIKAYEAAKATGKLEVLTALVYETTQRIMAEAYTQQVPKGDPAKLWSYAEGTQAGPSLVPKPEQAELESDPEETWA